MRRHDYDKEATLRERVRSEPARPEGYAELGAWLLRSGRLAQAREVLQAGLAQASRTARIHHLLGLIFAGAGDLDAGERHLARTVDLDPGRFEYLRDLGLVQGAAGRVASSVDTLRQAVALGGDAAAGLEWLVRFGERAMAEMGAKPERRPPALSRRAALVERIVARDPAVAEVLAIRRAELSPDERENLRAARRALARLAARNPGYADVHFGLSLVAEQLGEVDRAIEAAEKAIAINPRYAEACLLAVRLYQRSGKADRAAEACRKVTELRPEWLDAHLRLGGLMRDQGRPGEAADAYRRALAVSGRCDEAKRGLAESRFQAAGGKA
jgi:tetratricopeptide (TPR) repeat protein